MPPSSGRLILVRHALPAIDRDVPAPEWHLGEEGHRASRALAPILPDTVGAIFASTEPKAIETAEPIAERFGLDLKTDERFREVSRPTRWDPDIRERTLDYLRGANYGWEPQEAVASRFSAGVEDALEVADGELVVVTHGQAMTLYLATQAQIDVTAFWESLRFPDAWSLDPSSERLWRLTEL